MSSIVVNTKSLFDQTSDALILFIEKNSNTSHQLKELEQLYPNIEEFMAKRNFKALPLDLIVFPLPGKQAQAQYAILVGLGATYDKELINIEVYRRALAKAIRSAISMHCTSVAIQIPSCSLFGIDHSYLIEQSTIITRMTTYHFDEYITQQDRKETIIQQITFCIPSTDKNTTKAIKEAECVAAAVNKARHWVDAPPLFLTPLYLTQKARHIAETHNLDITVFDEQQIIKMGMGGLAAVSQGSEIDCQLVIMEYNCKKKNAPTLAFVGKGITFDSGGLSLKPAQSMETMKEDMSGAAAVIATMEVLAQLKPKVNVIALAPLSENLPSGKATKPGDIIRFYNGKTAEIKNTDAEGRLILADALSYAVKHYKLDAIVDLATLTGACAYALGPFHSGLMSQHDDLVEKIEKAAHISGEKVWRLPMSDDYRRAIHSHVADICNIGDNRIKAGAITAAHFLQNFVEDIPWAHLDIAGTAFDVPNIPYYRFGATGWGVRFLTALAMNW